MNNISLIGRIATELKIIVAGNSVVCKFNLAVDRKGTVEKVTDFIPCEVWGNKAKALVENTGKGKLLGVKGEYHINEFTDSEGKKRWRHFVAVNETDILEWNNNSNKDDSLQFEGGDIPFPPED